MASVNEETGSGYYSKGNEAFVAENYSSAIDLYTAALGIDHLFADFLLQEHMPTSSLISLNKPKNCWILRILVHSNPNQITITNVAIWLVIKDSFMNVKIDCKAIHDLVDQHQGEPSDEP